MLSPEVWRFPPPKSGLRVRSNLPEKSIFGELSVNNFYHNIFVLCADTHHDIPVQLEQVFEDSSYYKILNCCLADLLQHDVIQGFLKKGQLSCLSVGTEACIVSILPKGILSIVLNSHYYQELGIEGKKISKGDREPAYHIEVNLTDDHFKPGKKLYNRIQERLRCFKKFTLILRWEPDDERICPSSIAKYLAEKGLQIEVCTPKLRVMRQHTFTIPLLNKDDISSLVEWMGMIAIGGDLHPEDSHISTYSCEENQSVSGHITAFNISGLFTSHHLQQLRQISREIIDKKVSSWVGVTAQCFSNTPSIRELKETKNYIPSDRILTVIFCEEDEMFCESFKSN